MIFFMNDDIRNFLSVNGFNRCDLNSVDQVSMETHFCKVSLLTDGDIRY